MLFIMEKSIQTHCLALRHHSPRSILSVWRGGVCTHFNDMVNHERRAAWKDNFRMAMLVREYCRSRESGLLLRKSFRTITQTGEKPQPIEAIDEALPTRQRARLIEQKALDTFFKPD